MQVKLRIERLPVGANAGISEAAGLGNFDHILRSVTHWPPEFLKVFRILADRVETPVAARPAAISTRLDVLSEFSEPGNSVCEHLSNAVTLDNVSELISCGVQAWLLGRERGNQLWKLHDIEDAPEIVGERGQAELAANLLQPSHQKRTLVHPLLDRAERVFDRLAALIEDVGALRYAGLHSVQDGLVTAWSGPLFFGLKAEPGC
jgi:hypothetical protein